MGVMDLVSWLFGPSPADEVDITDRHRQLSEAARSDRITADLLARSGDRTRAPVVSYLEEGEQPHYILRGTRLLIVDEDDTQVRKHPTRLLVVMISDSRVLYVLGGRLADDIFEVPLTDVRSIYFDEDEPRCHVVVEADRDGDRMTFFADVSLAAREEVVDSVEYARSR